MPKVKAKPVKRVIVPEPCSPRRNPHFIAKRPPSLIARSTLTKVVREILAELRGRGEIRVQGRAIEALASASESFLEDCYMYAHAFLNHRNGRCFSQRDFRLGVEVVTRDMPEFVLPWPESERVLARKHIHERHAEQIEQIRHYVQNAHKAVISVPSSFTFGQPQ